MNKNYKIYSLSQDYEVPETKWPEICFEGTIEEVVEKLQQNESYHIRINPNKACIAFGHFDHTSKTRFKEFLNLLCEEFECSLDEISYTKSKY